MAEEQDQGFTVRDRRGSAPEAPGAEEHQTGKGPAAADTPHRREQQESGPIPPLDFTTFVLSLATTAQIALGLVPDPQNNAVMTNLAVAKQMIDILGMLQGKTSGNLTRDEQALLDSVLTGLRMSYVKVREGKK